MSVRAEDGLAFGLAVGLPDLFDVEDGEHDAFGIAQGDRAARLTVVGEAPR